MKRINNLLVVILCTLAFYSCKSSGDKDSSTDLITIKTLGLAYLEEFKLEDAEVQFKKFIDLAPKEKLGYANLGLVYLRMAKYPEAEKQLLKAIKIDARDPDIRHILATVYKMQDNTDKAIEQLQEALKISPDHIKVLYDLTEIYATRSDEHSEQMREQYMIKLTEKAPGNLVPQLNLTDIYIRKGNFDKAVQQLETIRQEFPDFPREAVAYYDQTLASLKKSDKENSIIQFTIFHNYLKVTSPYQAGIMDLKGPGGSLIGFPLITFDQQSTLNSMDDDANTGVIRFTNATASSGLEIIPVSGNEKAFSHITSGDFDSDGDIDIYAGSFDQASGTYKHYLLSNEMGRFTDITREAGLTHSGIEYDADFADYDNDGFFDLLVLKEGGSVLYRNAGKATFENVTKASEINKGKQGTRALLFDADHDGDLDIYELSSDRNLLYRNNADGTFIEQAEKMGIATPGVSGKDAAFGDFDEDGDIDLAVANENAGINLYSNQRQGVYKDIADAAGLKGNAGSGALAVGDYNNDGYQDLFVASLTGKDAGLFINQRNGNFKTDEKAAGMFSAVKNLKVSDAGFLDVDNDGFLDLIICGQPEKENGRGLFLYRSNGKGGFTEANELLPEEPKSARQFTAFDYNDDGDLDLALAGLKGGVFLLRNDGGNNNHFIKMKLVGLKAGSAKNNHYGIGAKVEVRSGELYQTMVVTDPNVHFGLGNRKQADVVRITWTNGVPQNIFMPNSDQALIEAQTLKGSCPFLYTWNGSEYTFVKDILWRSALGMPLGIMGGNTAYAFADASDDYLKIPGESLVPRNNRYSIKVTSELWETIYLDQLELVAVDHPASVDIFVPEQFSPPPFPGRKIVKVKEKRLPVSAFDSKGNNVLALINKKDDVYLSDFKTDKYQGITEMKYVIVDPGKTSSDKLLLFMNGWIFPTDASINVALSQSDKIKVESPVIQVVNSKGEWVTVIDNPGFPMGKDKTVIVDLSGKFLSKDHRIRIRTNMEIYWDYIFFSNDAPELPVVITDMKKLSADLHYRGFSHTFRKGGRYGPHWFDYGSVDKEAKWRDLKGNYTRYGDVVSLLGMADNKYIISNAGDEVTIEFAVDNLPKLPAGWKRDFLIRSVGWVKDGDLNTAFGSTVEPLPFHGMKYYSPGKYDAYPKDPVLEKYNKEYNTRVVTSDGYLNALQTDKN
jgi:tetratricopeptide (TPR) repeat protein